MLNPSRQKVSVRVTGVLSSGSVVSSGGDGDEVEGEVSAPRTWPVL